MNIINPNALLLDKTHSSQRLAQAAQSMVAQNTGISYQDGAGELSEYR